MALACLAPMAAPALAGGAAPVPNEPSVRFRLGQVTKATTPGARVLLTGYWTASSGATSYTLMIKASDGVWRTLGTTSAASLNFNVEPKYGCHNCSDGMYTLCLKARNSSATSACKPGHRFLVAQYQNTHDALKFSSGWTYLNQSDAFEGSVRRASSTGRTVQFIAGNAQRLAVVATRASGRGTLRFKVTHNNTTSTIGSVSLNGAYQARRQVWVASRPGYDPYVFTMERASGLVDIDALLTIGDV